MCNFLKEDILILAKAILENPVQTSSGDYITYLFCEYCDAELHGYQFGVKDFKHDLNCPVLVAQDILTGNEI